MGSSLPAWVGMLPGMDVSGLSIPQHPALEQRRMLPWVTLHMSFDFSVFVTQPTEWTRVLKAQLCSRQSLAALPTLRMDFLSSCREWSAYNPQMSTPSGLARAAESHLT